MFYRKIMSRDEFMAINGPAYDAGMERYPHGISKVEQRRIGQRLSAGFASMDRVDAAYAQMLGMGVFREYTPAEEMVRTCRGMDELPAVQAARRIAARREIDWTDHKWDYLESQPLLEA